MSRIHVTYTVKPDNPNRQHGLKVLRILSRLARQKGLGVTWSRTPSDGPDYVDLWISVPDPQAMDWFADAGEKIGYSTVTVNCENTLQEAAVSWVIRPDSIIVSLAKELEDWEIENPIPGSLPLHHPEEVRE